MEATLIVPILVTIADAAAMLSCSRRTIENLVHDGTLPRRKLGRRTLIPRAAIEQLARRDVPVIGGREVAR